MMEKITRKIKKVSTGDRLFYIGLVSFLIITIIVTHVFIYIAYIPSESMEPAIKARSIVTATRQFDADSIKRGDIIFFKQQAEGKTLVKRVIALPGETVKLKGSDVYVDGKVMKEPYIKEKVEYEEFEMTVPQELLFVMGDNRSKSVDSRFFGCVQKENIIAVKKAEK